MAQIIKNGRFEVRFNEDKTQALATIYPPEGSGESVTAPEIIERLKAMGVTYGVREQAILDAVHHADETGLVAGNIIVAQGAVPQDGQDAKIRYTLPLELVSKPLPKRKDGSHLPDWFALDPAKLVKAGDELATIVPAQPGTPGKSLTWPIQTIQPAPGKPARLCTGQNIRSSEDGFRLFAEQDGYLCLQGDTLENYALRLMDGTVLGGVHHFPAGVVFMLHVRDTQIRTGGTMAVRGAIQNSEARVAGDLFITHAENCSFIVTGNVYVTKMLKNCDINTPKQVIALESAEIVGGYICATGGVKAINLGDTEFTSTEVRVNENRFSMIRDREIKEELADCEANIARITQALRPFTSVAVHTSLPDDKRLLLQKLQMQKRTQEMRTKELHNERRLLSITAKEKHNSVVAVTGTAHPGVWIYIGKAAMQLEEPLNNLHFSEGPGGKSVQTQALARAA